MQIIVRAEALRTRLQEEDLAWSRAQHGVESLGTPGELNCLTDTAARAAACIPQAGQF